MPLSSVTRHHPMPFGAFLQADGLVRFRVWAPGANSVELCVQSYLPEICLCMNATTEGWYELTTALASVGTYYQYRINGKHNVPDPASRYQPQDVHRSSQVINPEAWQWQDNNWKGLPWEDVVFYQVHVGTFSREGTFAGVKKRLDYLVDLGVTAVQLMPLSDFPGRHNWGYDGVLPFAPDSSYGTPDELKDLIASAHAKGLMVFNDVVYNHFGPEGNYLHLYAPLFFHHRVNTPWGKALNFDKKTNYWVRQYFIHNALYWLEEYHFDGLRFDAVQTVFDESSPHVLEELAEAVRQGPGRNRHIYLVQENDANAAHYFRRDAARPDSYYDAQWNDDIHHVLHVMLTGETVSYYQDYTQRPVEYLGRCLTEGFAYQGEVSAHRGNNSRGEACLDISLSAFIAFLQNHDQVGNRALGERIASLCSGDALRAATALLLLIPSPPMLFMGQEWGSQQPFTFFVDFPDALGQRVNRSRLQELRPYSTLSDDELAQKVPPANDESTFQLAKLAWEELNQASHQQWHAYHRALLRIRKQHIRPVITQLQTGCARFTVLSESALSVQWPLKEGAILCLIANLSNTVATVSALKIQGTVLFASDSGMQTTLQQGYLKPWSVLVYWR